MAGKFEVYQGKDGKWRFRLKAGNGEVVASGQGYATKEAAMMGCEAVQNASSGALVRVSPGVHGRSSGESGTEERQPNADTSGENAESQERPRRFRFTAGMSSDLDLAERSEEILRGEFGRGK